MALTDKQLELLRSDDCVTITVRPGGGFTHGSGFVRAVHADRFELDHITNPDRYFSNYSDAPEFKRVTILFADVIAVKR